MAALQEGDKLRAELFYWNYHGHKIEDLTRLHSALKKAGCRSFVWLAGDSSMDNKHWLFEGEKSNPRVMDDDDVAAAAVNGYERVLVPPRMVKDVCYWLNVGLEEHRQKAVAEGASNPPFVCAINTAIEESTLGDREGGLLDQDRFILEHIGPEDVLVVNVGGNDIALKPTKWTALNMGMLIFLSCTPVIRWLSCAFAPCLGCYCGFPLGFSYFVNMFRHKTQRFMEKLVAKQKPKRAIACMLYYLDEKSGGSWADQVLGFLGYDTNPAKLQAVIRRVFEVGTSKIALPGIEVVPFPLYRALDGTDSADYMERVEPSAQGGQKMAQALLPEILA